MAKAGQGQTLNDRLNAARYALAGHGLARVVCKATTEEVIGPKKKHLDYLLQCTHEPNVSIPQLANLLIERTNHSSWVVVFKALITVHHLMCYGNERFTQYLASSNCTFQLNNFLDKSNIKGYDMSTYIKRYSRYINEKALSYRTVAFDFAKIKRGKEDGHLRTMPSEKLLKNLAVLQNQIDALLEFDCPANHLNNGVINGAFMLLFRDLIRLFACYNDGIINLLEKFFEMNKKQCREALDVYKKFLTRMDRVAEFLKVAENVGIDKGEIPDLTKAPSSLLQALEQHLQALEGNKKGKSSKDAQPSTAQTTSNNFSSSSSNVTNEATEVKDEVVKKALEEEAKMMNQLKNSVQFQEKHVQDQTKKPYNPFLSSPSSESKQENTSKSSSSDILDLFGSGSNRYSTVSQPSVNSNTSKASDDLLMLASNSLLGNSTSLNSAAAAGPNPFADILYNSTTPSFNGASSFNSSSGGFDANFAAVFGSQNTNSNTSSGTDFKSPPERPPPPPSGQAARETIRETSQISGQTSDCGIDNKIERNVTKSQFEGYEHYQTREPKEHSKPIRPPIPTATAQKIAEEQCAQEQCTEEGFKEENLQIPSQDPAVNRSTSPSPTADIIRGDGTTPILPTPPEPATCEEENDAKLVPSQGDPDEAISMIKAPPPSCEHSPFALSFENLSNHKLGKEDLPEKPKKPSPPAMTETSNILDGSHIDQDLFGFENSFASETGQSIKEPLVSGVTQFVPVVAASAAFPGVYLPSTQPITDPNQLAYIHQQHAQLLARQQQMAKVSSQVLPQPSKPRSAFEDLDQQMRSTMASKIKEDQQKSSPNQVTPTFPYTGASAAVFVPGQGIVPVAIPPGMAYSQPMYMSAVPSSAAGFDAFGDILQPQKSNILVPGSNSTNKSPSTTPSSKNSSSSLIKGDLDSSLASLAQNLDIKGPKTAGFKKF